MKNKILFSLILIISVMFNGVIVAAKGQTNNGMQQAAQVEQQTQNQNQGDESQQQIQNQEQTGTTQQAGQQIQTQQQEQVQMQTGEPGQNEPKQEQNMNQSRRSEVANAVHELLDVADRTGGIGEQVRVIAQAQQQNQEQIEESVEKIQKQNKITTFILGPNHGEINKAAKLTIQNEEKINELKELQTGITEQEEIQKINDQIQVLEKANLEVKTTLEEAQKTFSLFGWLRKLFAK